MLSKPRGRTPKAGNGAAQEIVQLYESGTPAAEIAGRFECSIWSIYKILRRAGVRRRSASQNLDPEAVRDLYESGKTLAEVARILQCTASMVYTLMRRAQIPRRGRGRPAGRVTDPDRDRAMAGMRDGGATLQEIGNVFGLTRERVRQVLNSMGYNVDPSKPREPRRKRMRRGVVEPTPESLNYLVGHEGLSPAQIARRLGRNVNVVRDWLGHTNSRPPEPGRKKR